MKDYSLRVIDFECAKPYLKDLEHQICIAAFYTFIFLYLTQQNSRIHILMYTLNGNVDENSTLNFLNIINRFKTVRKEMYECIES